MDIRSLRSVLLILLLIVPSAIAGDPRGNLSITDSFMAPSTTTSPIEPTLLAKPDASMRAAVSAAYGKLPLIFEANTGQTDSQVKFLSRGSGYSLFLTPTEVVLALSRPASHKGANTPLAPSQIEGARTTEPPAVLRMKLMGANPAPQMEGQDQSSTVSHYFIGNEPEKWRTNIPNYAKVKYTSVYPGVNLIYYGNQHQLEYDFVVAPGADPQNIRLTFEGARDVRVDARGDLVLRTAGGEIRQRKPVIYQEVDGARREISGRYKIRGRHQVGFQIAQYDGSRPLVIDPVLSYSTYFGNSTVAGYDIAVDSSGNAYITGSGVNIPTQNPLFPFQGGNGDAFVAKLNAAGSALLYSTYLGGNGPDAAFGIALDSSGDIYVMGQTESPNFPTRNPFQANAHNANGICTSYNQLVSCLELFVTRLNATGSALVYSTYLGGIRGEYGVGGGLAVDSSGNAYLTGDTDSTDFPTTSNAFQGADGFGGQVFLTKLNTNASGADSLIYSTYVMRSRVLPTSRGVAVDSSGNAYVISQSDGRFPSTEKAFQRTVRTANFPTVVIVKLNTNPLTCTPDSNANILCKESLLYSTYLDGKNGGGGTASDIAVDSSDHVYVTGDTGSTDFPTTPGAFQPAGKDDGTGLVYDAFVTKLNINPPICTPDEARNINCKEALVYSTYLGGSRVDRGLGIALDASGNAYVTGETSSTDFPVKAPFQLYKDNDDAFVAKLNLNAAGPESLVYSTYLGGSDQEQGMRIAVDSAGDAYVTGRTPSTDFPTTPGSLQPAVTFFGQSRAAFVSKITPVADTFLVSAIGPNKGGNTGFVSANVYGLGFKSGAAVKLARTGQPDIVGDSVSVTGGIQIAARFNLVGQENGLWDVTVTNPNGQSATLPQGFTIELGRFGGGYVDIIGATNFRAGGTGRIAVTYGNRGNTDILLPVFIRIPQGIGFQLGIPILHQQLLTLNQPVDFSGLPITVQRPDDPNTPQNEAETIIPLIVKVPPGFTGSIPITLSHPSTNCSGVQVTASVGAPLELSQGLSCFLAVASTLIDFIPGEACVGLIIDLLFAETNAIIGQPASLTSFIASTVFGLVQCAASVFPPAKVFQIALKATEIVANVADAISACGPLIPSAQSRTLSTSCVSSRDPNDKIGASGAGAARYLSGEESLRYTILFENKPDATAAAQDVVITDQLDKARLDLATFSLGPIAFGDRTVVPPSQLTEFSTDVDLRPANNLIVRINAKLDTETGILTWRFTSLNPATLLPTDDPLAGFLPPNVNPPAGDGAVFFSVMPKPGLATGTEIRNGARIVFDVNVPIDTPVWLNTMDNSTPQSQVLPLAATQSSSAFNVSWSGTDTGSGISTYSIFVAENGGPFTPFLTNTPNTSATFTGQSGRSYGFFSIARDAAGNVQGPKTLPDALTQVKVILRGDANGDDALTVGDIFYLINHIFAGGAAPVGNGDANSDGGITAGDIFFLINHLFAGGPAPQTAAARPLQGLGRSDLFGSIRVGSHDGVAGRKIAIPVRVETNGSVPNAIAFKVVYSPASAVKWSTIRRAGITATRSPLFEAATSTADSVSYVAAFSPGTLSGDQPGGAVVAEIEIELRAGTAETELSLTIDPETATMGDLSGNSMATVASGSLRLSGGTVTVRPRDTRPRMQERP